MNFPFLIVQKLAGGKFEILGGTIWSYFWRGELAISGNTGENTVSAAFGGKGLILAEESRVLENVL
jgi:hypothetical protein